MKKLALILMLAISSSAIFAAVQNDDKKMPRKEKRKAETAAKYELTKSILQKGDFVLESDFLQNRYGYRAPVSSMINFVKVEGGQAVIQVGSNHHIGYNGVGGITAKGRITNWELKENDKNKSFVLKMDVMSSIGIYTLFFNVSAHGNASASLTGLRPGRLTFDGDVVALNESLVYEGHSI